MRGWRRGTRRSNSRKPGDIVQERLARLDATSGNGQQSEALVDVPQIVRVVELLDQWSRLRRTCSARRSPPRGLVVVAGDSDQRVHEKAQSLALVTGADQQSQARPLRIP
jgi:hypothetical protein